MSIESDNLKRLFEKIKDDTGMSRAEFIRRYKIPGGQTMVYQHLKDLKPVSLQAGIAYAKGFGCSLRDISPALSEELERAKPVFSKEKSNVIEHTSVVSKPFGYPIISWVQAGKWTEIVDQFPVGSANEYFYAIKRYGPHAFALTIIGDSMEPEYREGDIILIDPDVSPRPGDCVVAKNHQEEATFKKYRSRGIGPTGEEIFELVPLNQNYATIRSDEANIKIIGVMMEHTRIRKP